MSLFPTVVVSENVVLVSIAALQAAPTVQSLYDTKTGKGKLRGLIKT